MAYVHSVEAIDLLDFFDMGQGLAMENIVLGQSIALGCSGRRLDATHAAFDLLPAKSLRTGLGVRWP
jgi:hypothetical protein